MATERALPARVEELQREAQAREERIKAQEAELDSLRARLAQVDASEEGTNLMPANTPLSSLPREGREVRVSTQLKRPDIERFTGDREKTAEFIMAIDDRLETTGQTTTLVGLEFAVSHLVGYAASWWRFYRAQNPLVRSWPDLKSAFAKAFEMVDEQRVYEKRLFALTQTDSVEEYVDEFLTIAVKLPQLDDAFKQRRFSDGACPYLQEKYAGQSFDSLLDMVNYTMRLVAAVHPSHFTPQSSVTPVVAAIAAKGGKPGSKAKCFRCGRSGHVREDCYAKLDKSKPDKQQSGKHGKSRRPTKGTARFGKYDGSGRVNAIEADTVSTVADSESDDDLRQGNDQA